MRSKIRQLLIGIGMASPARIDEINILQATYEAMRQAIAQLNPQPQVLLNDAVRIPGVALQAGTDHQRRREESFDRGGERACQGDERSIDAGI